MRTLRLSLEYDGAAFHGWARQPGLRTVQGVLEDAVRAVWPEAGPLAVAGRTDAGVHASGQVASLRVAGGPPAARVPLALNQLLPNDVAVLAASDAADDFHARHSARARCYEYTVFRARVRSPLRAARAYHHPRPLELAVLAECAARIVGEHDFRAFTPTETQHSVFQRHVLAAAWSHDDDLSVLRIEADSFLHHMVRNLVGTMLECARGRREPADLERLLRGAAREEAGPTAPAHALCLVGVRYDEA